jgi:hypothetical protein
MTIERDSGNCPTCGQRVGTFTAEDGTSYYMATAEQEASELVMVREQRDRLLVAAAAALERTQVDDPGEATMILEAIVTLDGKYVWSEAEKGESL